MPYKSPQDRRRYFQAYYRAHRSAMVSGVMRRKETVRSYVRQWKSQPCQDCGIQYPYYVMDFDHRDGERKEFEVSRISSHTVSLARVRRELQKCDVVCSNCHRERTHARSLVKNPTAPPAR